MPNARTKAAILKAMEAAHDEGLDYTWVALDHVFAAMATGDTVALAELLKDARANREAQLERSPENVTTEDEAAEPVLPACVRPDTGSRSQ